MRCSCEPAQDPIGHPGDLLAAEDADDLVDLGKLLEQDVFLPLGQAAGDDHALDRPGALPLEHLLDHAARFLPGRVDEPAGIDDDQVGLLPLGHQREPVLRQQPEHPLGIDQVLGAAQADKADRPFGFLFSTCGIVHRSVVLPGDGCLKRLGGLPGLGIDRVAVNL